MKTDTPEQELLRIREWHEATERDPYAFGPSLDERQAIKTLLTALDARSTTSDYQRALNRAARLEGAARGVISMYGDAPMPWQVRELVQVIRDSYLPEPPVEKE